MWTLKEADLIENFSALAHEVPKETTSQLLIERSITWDIYTSKEFKNEVRPSSVNSLFIQ